jgi:type II secretory pathway predicted ATPase ExeA/phage tail protein X
MYEDFYNLREKPFNLTPSPRFLYLSEGHREALSLMKYGVMERMGFILLTGEVGTGKTTIVHALLDSLDSSVKYVHLSNPLLSSEDLFHYLALSTFKEKLEFGSKTHFLLVFQAYLKQALKDQTNFILIIDEAHKLSFELLEEIRLLSNMETGDDKLINIFLVGQPELNKKLSDPTCRALLQRISIRHHIPPLNFGETRDYMANRLKVAGAKNFNHIFSKSAVETIHSLSRGFPREINVLADNALLLGYAKGIKKVTPAMVRECYEDLRIDSFPEKGNSKKTEFKEIKESNLPDKARKWKWAAVLLVCFALFGATLTSQGRRIFSQFSATLPSSHNGVADSLEQSTAIENRENEQNRQELVKMDLEKIKHPMKNNGKVEVAEKVNSAKGFRSGEGEVDERFVVAETESNGSKKSEKNTERVQESAYNRDKNELAKMADVAEEARREDLGNVMLVGDDAKPNGLRDRESLRLEADKDPAETTVIVKQGDTLTILAMAVYGRVDESILETVHQYNPGIEDINWIYEGQKITFPPLSESIKTAIFTVHIASYKPFEPAFEMFQRLMKAGYEVYMIPVNNPDKGTMYRLTLGAFESLTEAKDYAISILDRGVSDYAKALQLDME